MTISPEAIIAMNIAFDAYAAHEGINQTELNMVDRMSLAHVKHKRDGAPEKESDERDFGRAFHSMLLEDKQDFVIHPLVYPSSDKPVKASQPVMKPWNWNANYCKNWREEQALDVLSHAESDALMGMVASVRDNEELNAVIKNARNEVSIFAEKNGTKMKARIDTLPVSGPIIDFKSTTNANPQKFVRQALDSGYFLQAAFYLDLLALADDRRSEFWFVAIEKTAPYAHSIIKLKDGPVSFIGMGRARYRCALSKLKQAIKDDKWPSYASIDAELVAPVWALKEMEES